MKKNCEICLGSGQISYFQGVSRFLLSWEECPECQGMGYTIIEKEKEEKKKNCNETALQNNGIRARSKIT